MAKSALRLEAIRLRKQGKSVQEIAKKIGVARSTTSLWTRDVPLTAKQVERLKQNLIHGGELGRLKGSQSQKNARLTLIEKYNQKGKIYIGSISNRELDIAGLCIYWSEGSKKNRRVELCNSDPKLIQLFINWLKKIYKIDSSELKCYVGINDAHRSRENIVKEYWSNITKIPLTNFTKTSFKKYPLKKEFSNFNEHFGTLSVRVPRPARIFYQILGKIHAISNLAM